MSTIFKSGMYSTFSNSTITNKNKEVSHSKQETISAIFMHPSSLRILERDTWFVFGNDVVLPSWTLILPESWDESKTNFKGEAVGFKIGEGEVEGRENTPFSPLATPSLPPSMPVLPYSFLLLFKMATEFPLKNAYTAGYLSLNPSAPQNIVWLIWPNRKFPKVLALRVKTPLITSSTFLNSGS